MGRKAGGGGAAAGVPGGSQSHGRRRRKRKASFKLAHPDCAGIDVGSSSHFVAVPPDRDSEPVREFRSFSDDLNHLADWLSACGIRTVVMESTGVYLRSTSFWRAAALRSIW